LIGFLYDGDFLSSAAILFREATGLMRSLSCLNNSPPRNFASYMSSNNFTLFACMASNITYLHSKRKYKSYNVREHTHTSKYAHSTHTHTHIHTRVHTTNTTHRLHTPPTSVSSTFRLVKSYSFTGLCPFLLYVKIMSLAISDRCATDTVR